MIGGGYAYGHEPQIREDILPVAHGDDRRGWDVQGSQLLHDGRRAAESLTTSLGKGQGGLPPKVIIVGMRIQDEIYARDVLRLKA